MKRLQDMIDRLKKVESDILETIEKTLREIDHIIIDMNVEDQLYDQGIDRDGDKISSYAPYSTYTVQVKQALGQVTARVTLRAEGDFHDSFYIDFTKTGFEIKASDEKAEGLAKSYGKQIFGLTDENFQELLREYIAPEVTKILKRI